MHLRGHCCARPPPPLSHASAGEICWRSPFPSPALFLVLLISWARERRRGGKGKPRERTRWKKSEIIEEKLGYIHVVERARARAREIKRRSGCTTGFSIIRSSSSSSSFSSRFVSPLAPFPPSPASPSVLLLPTASPGRGDKNVSSFSPPSWITLRQALYGRLFCLPLISPTCSRPPNRPLVFTTTNTTFSSLTSVPPVFYSALPPGSCRLVKDYSRSRLSPRESRRHRRFGIFRFDESRGSRETRRRR